MESSLTYQLERVCETDYQISLDLIYEGAVIASCFVKKDKMYVPGFYTPARDNLVSEICSIEASSSFGEADALVLISKLEATVSNPKFEIFNHNNRNKVMLLKSVLESCNYTRFRDLYVLHG